MLRVWNLSLLISTFCLTILGTYLTRSGILSSVHAFGDGPVGNYLLAFFDTNALVRANPRFRATHTLTREPEGSGWEGRRGRIGAALLEEAARGLDDPTWYVCGKPEMVRGAAEALLAMGVARERVAYEMFPGYA